MISNSDVEYEKKSYYFSPPRLRSRKMAIPSIRLAAEFPRNLLRGFRVPSIRI